jgi:uncharacterized membrane protein YphA (DoxX/SURF4 family)
MNISITRQQFGAHVLRIGLACVFLWFGFSQLIDSIHWVSIVPQWAVDFLHLPPAMIVMTNGVFEVVCASLLAMGFFVRTISFLLAFHLIFIAFDFGLSATGIRDLGLVFASFALSLLYTSGPNTGHPINNNSQP